MAITEHDDTADTGYVGELEQQMQELAECLMTRAACQDEVNAKLTAEIEALRELARTREVQLREFAEALASGSGFVQARADRLLDQLG